MNAKQISKTTSYISAGKIISCVFFMLSLASVYCHAGNYSNTEVRPLEPFSKIIAGGLVNIELKQGSSNDMKISASGIKLNEIISRIDGDTLLVTTSGTHRGERIAIEVNYKTLSAIETRNSATIKTNGVLESDIMDIKITDAGDADLELDVGKLSVDMRGNGNLELKGSANEQTLISHGGGGRLNNSKLKIQ